MVAVAELEAGMISTRTKAALQAAKARCKTGGPRTGSKREVTHNGRSHNPKNRGDSGPCALPSLSFGASFGQILDCQGNCRLIEISFPDQSAAQSAELVQELRQALLREGAKPEGMALGRSDPQAMSHADYLQIVLATWQSVEPVIQNVLHNFSIGLMAAHVAELACEVCIPARAGIRIKIEGKEFRLSAEEINVTKLEKILSALASDEKPG